MGGLARQHRLRRHGGQLHAKAEWYRRYSRAGPANPGHRKRLERAKRRALRCTGEAVSEPSGMVDASIG